MPYQPPAHPLPRILDGAAAPAVLYGSSRWQSHQRATTVGQCLGAYALLGVVEGVHTIELEHRRWRMQAGDLAILPPGRPWLHRLARSVRILYAVGIVVAARLVRLGDSLAFRIDPREPSQPGPGEVWGVDLPVVQPEGVARTGMTDLAAVCDLWWRSEVDRMRANHLFAGILLRAVLATRRPDMRTETAAIPDPVVRRALDLVAEGIPPTSQIWAARVGLHRNRFAQRFQAVLGETPNAYLHRFRLHRAEALLHSGAHSLEYVAAESGFRNPAALSHAFRRAHGCGATAWRQRLITG